MDKKKLSREKKVLEEKNILDLETLLQLERRVKRATLPPPPSPHPLRYLHFQIWFLET